VIVIYFKNKYSIERDKLNDWCSLDEVLHSFSRAHRDI